MLIILLAAVSIVAVLLPNMVSCSLSSSQKCQNTKRFKIQNFLSQAVLYKLATKPIARTVFSVGLGGMFFV